MKSSIMECTKLSVRIRYTVKTEDAILLTILLCRGVSRWASAMRPMATIMEGRAAGQFIQEA